jgi:hypothetical protein
VSKEHGMALRHESVDAAIGISSRQYLPCKLFETDSASMDTIITRVAHKAAAPDSTSEDYY